MKLWERPAPRLLAVFFLLGLFAWWIFGVVSLPPSVRNLFEEDQAVVSAATPEPEEERFRKEVLRLPSPPRDHAPEVVALLQRLQNLPSLPYILEVALQRDAATPQGGAFTPWNETELQTLREVQTAYLNAWEPFLSGPKPDWVRFPDSILLFRSSFFLLKLNQRLADLLTYQPGQADQRRFTSDPRQNPEFFLSLLRQCRTLGAVRFGQLQWEGTETVRAAELMTQCVAEILAEPDFPLPALVTIRANLTPAPDLSEMRAGLSADRSLFLRTAEYLESLPPSASAQAGLTRLLQSDFESEWYLARAGKPASAQELGALLRRDASQLGLLEQKTFLPAPAWRQWLSGNPGVGLSPLLAQGLGGFLEFEATRSAYLVTQAALDARISWEQAGIEAVRKIPDPARPGSFFRVEESDEGVRLFSSLVRAGDTNNLSFLFPRSGNPTP